MDRYIGDIRAYFRKCGENVRIDERALILNPEVIEIGNNVRIDAFTKLVGGKGITIGDYVHIASFSSIMGGGECVIGDFVTFSYGVRIITGGDDFLGLCMTNPMVPEKYREFRETGKVTIGKHCILGTNTVVHSDVKLGEGTATGSGTIVTKTLPPWNVWIGAPARFHKMRKMNIIIEMEKKLRDEENVRQ